MAYFKHKATGSAALSVTTDAVPNGAALVSVRIHLGAASATSENLVISLDAADGAAYDVVLATQDMNTLADYVYHPTSPVPLFSGDKIKITWGNTNTETYGLTIIWQV